MDSLIKDLRRLGARWQLEHRLVSDRAVATNLRRLRVLAPLLAGVNALYALLLALQSWLEPLDDTGQRWNHDLALACLSIALWLAAAGYTAHQLRHAHRHRLARLLGVAVVLAALLFSVQLALIDQQLHGGTSAFLVGALLCSLLVNLPPLTSALLYASAGLVFLAAIGDPGDAARQLSLRLSGVSACAIGWALSLLLWRKFTTATLQQELIDKLQAELLQKQRELERLTRNDGLTRLYNRNTFVELTRRELQRGQRQGSATALLLIDLDHFKSINDHWGHPAGDAVLRQVAGLLSGTVRSTDLVGRLGGEEFIVLLPATNLETARMIAEKIRVRLEAAPTPWEQRRIAHTASIGVAATTAQERREFESLYVDADKALYIAKQRGRNRVV